MSDKSAIEWTDATWNPVTGCDQVSPGCDHCYALTMAKRLKAMGNPSYQTDGTRKTSGPGFGVALHPHLLDQPLKWKRPRRVFVNSMSDLFHPDIPDDFIASVFAVMGLAEWHTFQVLTKRPRRMAALLSSEGFHDCWYATRHYTALENERALWDCNLAIVWPPPNVWLGTSVENQEWADKRIPLLLETPAAVRFLSCEPLLGPIDLSQYLHGGVQERWNEDVNPLEAVPTQTVRFRCACGLEGLPTTDETMAESEWQVHQSHHLGLHWVIVGGESGPGARPMHPDWARSLRDQCVAAGVPFFFKQWGAWRPARFDDALYGPGRGCLDSDGGFDPWDRETICYWNESEGHVMVRDGKKLNGRELDGRTWDEMPERAS